MKQFFCLLLVLAMLLQFAGCQQPANNESVKDVPSSVADTNSLSDTAKPSTLSQDDPIMIADNYFHENPTDVSWTTRYCYAVLEGSETEKFYEESFLQDMVKEVFIIYGDENDQLVCSYDYFVWASEEDAFGYVNYVYDYGQEAQQEGVITLVYSDTEALRLSAEDMIFFGQMEDNTASAYVECIRESGNLVAYPE